MKKVIAVLAVVLMLAGSAFAGATTVTKELSQANYPGVLTAGSLNGASVFITDMSVIANTALFEYVFGNTIGLIALKTDMGTMGLSISPDPYVGLNGVGVSTPDNVLGLQYVTPMGGMNIGVGILYGVDTNNWKNKEIVSNAQNPDETSDFSQYAALKLGAALSGLDVGLTVALMNYGDTTIDLDNTSSEQEYKNTNDNSKIAANVSARLPLDKTLKVVAGIDFVTGQQKYTHVQDLNNDGTNEQDYDNIYTNMEIGVSALIGKDIKASETLTVKMATGLSFVSDSQALYLVDDRVADTKTYNGTSWSEITIRMPINFAIEGKLNDTWSINAGTNAQLLYVNSGADKVNNDTTASKFDDEETYGEFTIDPNLGFAVGVTGKIGDLTLDCYLNPVILLTGPYFLSGNGSGSLNYGIALSYAWK